MTAPVQITKYKKTTWGDKTTGEMLHGVKVFCVGIGWLNVSENSRAVLFFDPRKRDEYIKKMKSERDKAGFKLPRDRMDPEGGIPGRAL